MRTVRLIPYCLIILCLHLTVSLEAKDCTLSSDVELTYKKIISAIAAETPIVALHLADSLATKLQNQNKTNCKLFHWVVYRKGEALELLRRENEAVILYYEIIKNAKRDNHWDIVAQTYISVARSHEFLGRKQDCLRNLKEANKIIIKYKLNAIYSRYAVRYASYHRIFDNIDSTKIYATKAIEYGTKYNIDRSVVDGHLLMGMSTKDFEESIYHFQASVNIFIQKKNYIGATSQKANIAQSYLRNNELDKAQLHLDTAFQYADLMTDEVPDYYYFYKSLYSIKQAIAEAQGNIDSAYVYLKQAKQAGEQQTIRYNQDNINEREIAFVIEQEQEKLILERQQTQSLRGIIVLLLLLFIVGVLSFINNRQKRNEIAIKNKALNEALEFQSVLLSEIHHRVKNNLQFVISLLTIRSYKTADENIKTQLNDISNKVRSIALIHEQLYQTEVFEKINIQNYLNQLFAYFKTLDTTDNSFTFHVNTNNIELNLETIVPLGIVCSELISNSLKYAQSDETLDIAIVLEKNKDKFQLKYQDNGIGYSNGELEQKTNSMGMLLIKSMVRQLMADYETFNENGAVFQLFFKEKKVSTV